MYGSGTTEFTKAAIGIAHPATAAATTSLPIRRDGWLGPPICQQLLFRSSPAPVDAFPQSSRLTRPSEAAGCGIGDPGVGNDSGAVSRAIRPGGRLLRRGGAVVSPPPEPAAIVVARLRLEDSGFRLGLDKRFWATKIGPAQLPGGLAHNHSSFLFRERAHNHSFFFLKDQPTPHSHSVRLFRVANGEEKRRNSGAPARSPLRSTF